MQNILAIDQSTSATKAILFDKSGNIVEKFALPHQQFYPQPGWVEHDGEEIYRNTIEVLQTIFKTTQISPNNILCLSISNQRETIIVFNRETGHPLYNALVWQCRRGISICEELKKNGYSLLVQEKTGLPIDTYFSASKLKWLISHRPDIAQKLETGEALIGTIDTYLIYRLTKGKIFATDYTNACRTLLFDIKTLNWSQELCDIFDVPIQALPEIRESTDTFGETDIEEILESPLPICGVMGDSQASLFAQGCYEPGTAKVTFGSGSSVLLNTGSEMKRSNNGIVTTLAWVYQGQPTYAFEGITNFTGATISWLQNQIGLIDNPGETEIFANAVKDNDGVVLVPAFVGLSAPYWKPDAKAAILGLTPHSTKQHIVRAALESIAYRIRDVLSLMIADAEVDLQQIYADGGGVSNHFLMQFVSDILQINLLATNISDISPLGAVLAGLLGRREVSSFEELKLFQLHHNVFTPQLSKKEADEYYHHWRAAVNKIL